MKHKYPISLLSDLSIIDVQSNLIDVIGILTVKESLISLSQTFAKERYKMQVPECDNSVIYQLFSVDN